MPEVSTEVPLNDYTCQRCGYQYQKQKDWEPFLCHRCLRYIGKKVFTIMNQIVPAPSRPERESI